MKDLKNYLIKFVGLPDGEHIFDFSIKNSFFGNFEHSIIKNANLEVQLIFEKRVNFLNLHFSVSGTFESICDICTDTFDCTLNGEDDIVVKIVAELPKSNSEPDVFYIKDSDMEINISGFIYELITVNIPIQVTHPKDETGEYTCNPEALKYLGIQDDASDEDDDSDEADQSINPIWKELQKLKKQ